MKNLFATLALVLALLTLSATAYAAPAYKDMKIHQLLNEDKNIKDDKERRELVEAIKSKQPESQEDRDALYKALDNSHFDVQFVAIMYVMFTKEQRSIDKLVKRFKAAKVRVIKDQASYEADMLDLITIGTLGQLERKEIIPDIVDKVGSEKSRVESQFMGAMQTALTGFGADALPHIMRKLKEIGKSDIEGRRTLIYAIKNMKDKGAAPGLRKIFETEEGDLRTAVAIALGNMHEKVDVTRIIEDIKVNELEEKNLRAKRTEYEKNGQKIPQNLSDAETKNWDTRLRLLEVLKLARNPDALPFLKERVNISYRSKDDFYYDVGLELSAITAIGGPDALNYLIGLYEGIDKITPRPDRALKEKIGFLGVFGSKGFNEAIPFLTNLMNDEKNHESIRRKAAFELYVITEQQEYHGIYKKFGGQHILEPNQTRGN